MEANPYLNIEYHLFPRGYEVDFSLTLKTAAGSLKQLVEFALKQLVPAEAFEGGVILNVKGRAACGEESQASSERLLLLKGEFIPEEQEEDEEAQDFSLSILTSFKEFVGAKQIAHNVRLIKDGTALDKFDIRELGSTENLRFHELWLGMDLFTGTFIGSYFGFTPVVRDSFLLEAKEGELSLEMNSEALRTKRCFPFDRQPLLQKLPQLIKDFSGKDLRKIYEGCLNRQSKR